MAEKTRAAGARSCVLKRLYTDPNYEALPLEEKNKRYDSLMADVRGWNPMCLSCENYSCRGTKEQAWTGCVWKPWNPLAKIERI